MLIALKSLANGKFISAGDAGAVPLVAQREFPTDSETFELVDRGGGRVALRALVNGRYVCAEQAGAQPLVANRTEVGPWETFERVDLGHHRFALKAQANGRFVCAEQAGDRPLIANRTQAGEWETFEYTVVPTLVALRALANDRFVCADGAGGLPLVANRDTAAQWETFELIELGGGLVALRALANGRYVGVGAGTMLMPLRETIGTAETFQKVPQGAGGRFALRALANGAFVCADQAGRAPLVANRQTAGDWEAFETALVRAHAFSPQRHGFRFQNDGFANDFVPALDIRTAALCGGMSYATLDFYFAQQAVPAQAFRPAKGTTLYGHLYNRQVDSITNNLDKWAELIVNPFGCRSSEFFRWGLLKDARIAELRQFLDRGIPCVLGLRGVNGGDHQVVAFGYSMGRYQGDLGAHIEDFRIHIYDPNHAGEQRTLVADPARQVYHLAEGGGYDWISYFVDSRYVPKQPPAVRDPDLGADGLVHELVLEFSTGRDDLHGGNDNVDVRLDLADASQLTCRNVNLGARWVVGSNEWAEVVLPRPLRREDLRRLTVVAAAGGDPWEMSALNVNLLRGGRMECVAGAGPHCFTPTDRTLVLPL